tara:strand:+ start:298 stop:999 length:702 start_codon:yes stop_codon:yes gene_type:complete
MKWLGEHIWDLVSRFRNDVYLEDLSTSTSDDKILVVNDSTGKVSKGAGFILEDGDGTEVTIGNGKEVKFIKGDNGININWTDTSPGSDADPYDLTFNNTLWASWHGHDTIKILPRDFMRDENGSNSTDLHFQDDTRIGVTSGDTDSLLYAFVPMPLGATATHVYIYGSDTSAIAVFEMNVDDNSMTSKGTGNVGTNLDITDVTADETNYLGIRITMTDANTRIYGGIVTLGTS